MDQLEKSSKGQLFLIWYLCLPVMTTFGFFFIAMIAYLLTITRGSNL